MKMKVVKGAKPAPEPEKSEKAKRAPKEKVEPKKGRYTGATSGLGVTAFQNLTLEQNHKKKLTDEQLAELWREEFPNATEFTEKTVRGVRSVYNKGKHGQDGVAPNRISRPFDENGKEIPLRGEGKQ